VGQAFDGRAHAAALLRTLADAAGDPAVSGEKLASLAVMIGRHLTDVAKPPALASAAATSPLRVIDGDGR
jgi:hypothetical protein